MTVSAGPALEELYQEFGDRIAFATLYVREAHPGERYPQPQSFEEKIRHARDFTDRERIPWPVAVDDVDGTFHRVLDAKPNAAYLMDEHGDVAFRSLWSNDEAGVRRGLEAVAAGRSPAGESQARVLPMLRGLGVMYDVLARAGSEASRDVRRELPPLYGMARTASLFRPLPPLARSLAVLAVGAIGVVALAGGVRRLLRGPESRTEPGMSDPAELVRGKPDMNRGDAHGRFAVGEKVREDFHSDDSPHLRRRRAVVGVSLAGMAAMTPVSLLQTGVVKHLPDPPITGFDSDEANLSEAAFQFGVPDGVLALASLAANLPLAAAGAADRARTRPWLPLVAAGKALADAVGAGYYFYRMASGKDPWCAYCIAGAAANFGILALTLPEAVESLGNLGQDAANGSHTAGTDRPRPVA